MKCAKSECKHETGFNNDEDLYYLGLRLRSEVIRVEQAEEE